MAVNPGYTRRKELACTLEEMAAYGAVIPYEHEVVYVKQNDGRYAIKIGDGKTPLADLPYVVNYGDIAALKTAAENAKKLAEDARTAAEAAKAGAEAAVASLDIGITVVNGELCITFEEDI